MFSISRAHSRWPESKSRARAHLSGRSHAYHYVYRPAAATEQRTSPVERSISSASRLELRQNGAAHEATRSYTFRARSALRVTSAGAPRGRLPVHGDRSKSIEPHTRNMWLQIRTEVVLLGVTEEGKTRSHNFRPQLWFPSGNTNVCTRKYNHGHLI